MRSCGLRQGRIVLCGLILAFAVDGFAARSGLSMSDLSPQLSQRSLDRVQFIPIPRYPRASKPPLKDRLFTQKMVDQIMKRHEENFGPANATHFDVSPQSNADDYVFGYEARAYHGQFIYEKDETQEFGRYVGRRVVEHQVDQKLKDDTSLRPIYRTKERLTHAEISPHEKFKVTLRYDISGNYFRGKLINPWVTGDLLIELGEGSLGPTEVSESTISFRKDVPYDATYEFRIKTQDGIMALLRRKKLRKNLSGTITVSTFYRLSGRTERDQIIFYGFEWTI